MGMPDSDPDVVIVGGGFGGVAGAWQMTVRGRSAVLVEARDRLGGRSLTADHDGHPMELGQRGGTWVHPLQPLRVGPDGPATGARLETFPVLEGLRQAVVSGGRIVDLSDDDVARARGRRWDQYCAPGA